MRMTFDSRALFLATASIAIMGAAGAHAQGQPAAGQVDEVVVTASRVQTSGFTAPTPTTVVGSADIQARGATNVADVINEVPAFRASQTPAAASRGGTTSGGTFLDLRGLGAIGGPPTARTLVLVDGRRFVTSNASGQVDLNLIPSALVERTEVVTGGASAAWGSDAVAGVVNLILKDRMQGLEGAVSYGISDHGDYEEYAVNIAGGLKLGERGHVVAGVEYVDNRGIPDSYVSRDWGRAAPGNLVLTGARPAGLPSRIITGGVRISDRMTPGGIVVGGPLDNIEFLPNGQTRVFQPGALVGGNQMLGGDNQGVYFIGGSNTINPIQRVSLLGRFTYDISDRITAFVEASHGESEFRGTSSSRRDDANLVIQRDNAFLPDSVRQQMIARNLQTITVGRIAYDDNYAFYKLATDQRVDRIVGGLRGELGGGWKWDAYYQYGENRLIQKNQATINANYAAAVDAVRDASGAIVCRPGAAGADPGCVPFNIFGQNSPSQAAVNYVRGLNLNDIRTKQTVAAVNLSGAPITLPAGSVALAMGLEYRKEEASSTVNADARNRRFDLGNFQPIQGEYDTKEVYAEIAVPLLRDMPFANSLEVNAAARRTDYSTSGAVTTWKVGVSWAPIADLRLRATRSRDIRAPNINELFTVSATARGLVLNPWTGLQLQTQTISSGNRDLQPEKADTLTGGVVYQPSWLPGFRASVDGYKIEIDGVITQLTAQVVVDRCFAGVASLCDDITRTPTAITEVRVRQLNFNKLETNGVDFEVSYDVPESLMGPLPGAVSLRALGTYVPDLKITDSVATIDRAKQQVPEWTWNFTTRYSLGRFGVQAQVRYVSPTVFDTTLVGPNAPSFNPAAANSINDNLRPPIAYLNLSAQYDLIDDGRRTLQIFGVANNLFDQDPPMFAGSNPVGPSLYDLVGRAYRLGFRFKY